ncbi:hypothetical protein EmuJ_001072600 [Echinococcus multilocularis]|uniref:Uncharacterized protein n=1 Tax=Echinococcus multilocularis TaxID=6211 RepID=U6I6A8_ECHMU|nr:hypothetical protein EmuJ_001072400 [Echinococcus multilocularis]CDS42996.1 hypothetical protein EmuJ_001072600 [Echinococcus multilocularis]
MDYNDDHSDPSLKVPKSASVECGNMQPGVIWELTIAPVKSNKNCPEQHLQVGTRASRCQVPICEYFNAKQATDAKEPCRAGGVKTT